MVLLLNGTKYIAKISAEEREKIMEVRAKEYTEVIQKNHINLYPEETAAYYHLIR